MTNIRHILALLCFLGVQLVGSVAAAETPMIDHPVVDNAGVLSADAIDDIAQKLFDHHDTTGVQMAVLFVDTTDEEPIEDFSLRVAEQWEGGSAERDDGVLLTFAIDDRVNRLELGYGIEELISDTRAQQILNSATSALRDEDYAGATHQIVDQIIARTEHLEPGEPIASEFMAGTGIILTVFLMWIALFWTTGWQARRRGIYGSRGMQATMIGGTSLPTGGDSNPIDRKYRALHIAEHIMWWVPPTVLVGFLTSSLEAPGSLPVLEIMPIWSWMVAIWLLSSAVAAFLLARMNWELTMVSFTAFNILVILYPFATWASSTTGGAVFVAIFMSSIAALTFFLPTAVMVPFLLEQSGTLPEGTHERTFVAQSTSGSSSGGGGGGGYSGGGGSFGGGGASGSW